MNGVRIGLVPRTLLAALAIVASAGTGRAQLVNSPWPCFQQNLQHTGQSPINGPTTATLKWTYQGQQQLRSAPSVGADGTLYIGNGKAPLCAVDPANGQELWCSTIKRGGDAAQSQPAISIQGHAYIGARDNDLWAVFLTPQVPQTDWRFHVPHDGDVTAPPTVGPDGTVYFASNAIGAGFVYGFNSDGTSKWQPPTPGVAASGEVQLGNGVHNSSPTLNVPAHTVYFSTYDSRVWALNSDTGEVRWNVQLFPGPNGFRQSNFTVVMAPDGRLFVGARDGLHVVTPNPGNTDATQSLFFATDGRMESSASLATDGTLYFGASRGKKGTFYAVNSANAHLNWSTQLFGRFQNNEAAIGADGTVYLGVGKTVYSFAHNGNGSGGAKINWTFQVVGGELRTGPVISAPGTLLIAGLNHKMYAIGP
jgi:outer membrane protein assembly factor BamB